MAELPPRRDTTDTRADTPTRPVSPVIGLPLGAATVTVASETPAVTIAFA